MALSASSTQLGFQKQSQNKPFSSRPVAFKHSSVKRIPKHWPKALHRPKCELQGAARMSTNGIGSWSSWTARGLTYLCWWSLLSAVTFWVVSRPAGRAVPDAKSHQLQQDSSMQLQDPSTQQQGASTQRQDPAEHSALQSEPTLVPQFVKPSLFGD